MTVRIVLLGAALAIAACAKSEPPPNAPCTVGEIRCSFDGTSEETCTMKDTGAILWEKQVCAGGARCDAQQQRCIDLCGACDQPPSVCHKSTGTCWNGKCQYELADGKACDDGNPCTENDFCQSGACRAGPPKTCDQVPGDRCVDASKLQAYAATGVCKNGACDYPSATVNCALGCENGKCKGDPCQGVTCNQPPSSCHQAVGICSGGVCTYLPDDGKGCDDGDPCTASDSCVAGACRGTAIVCDKPPANTCKNANTLVSNSTQGTCKLGQCEYTKSEVPCSHGCDSSAGACKGDPCANVTCNNPPSGCYKAQGTCSNGSCTYAPDNGKSCSDGNPCTQNDKCTNGTCSGSQIVCNTPPSNTCKDANTLTVFTAPGSCNSQGSCAYASADVTCPFGCDGATGTCKGDPCATVTCDSPPNTQCYSTPGICSGGNCTYLPKSGVTCDDNNPCTHTDVCNSAGQCAGTSYSCSDSLVCTTDTCDGNGGCTFPVAQGSCLLTINYVKTCFQSGAQKSGNACQYCDPTKSQSTWSVSSGTQVQSWSFDDNTLQGWTVVPNPDTPASPVTWQVDSQRAHSGQYSLYFGNPTTRTFDDPGLRVRATLVSPTVTPPSGQGKLCLELAYFKDTENTGLWDILTVRINNGGTKTDVWVASDEVNRGDTLGTFLVISADVSAAAGSAVTFEIEFDSVDDFLNGYEGVYIDSVRLLSNCTP
ncbi:MAG: hypothetical protein KC503_39300 [Myxococcales bacterium]|nr:hypothetical protein [Myxococcales bacterium]